MDSITELAMLFKERDVKTSPSITTGIVLSPPPKPRIRLNNVIILEEENLVFASHLLAGYERKLKYLEEDWGLTTSVNDGGQGASSHKHYVNLTHDDALIQLTDTLKIDDEVILIPSQDEQLFYVIDKAVRF